ncbi:hypothetical protein AVEN_219324-1 [Araneus ventricosus]|uniref:Uncharacterized protein n=1 Tax=Araneus ventricosus TaxID=182803 RepID=A0A4Y2BH92_ARAVE|nr:hypothetical protein AVEN_219324-1 [Araneus ventricosus]
MLLRTSHHDCKTSSQTAILVCSNLALQICKLATNLTRQECKLETSLQHVNASFEVTTRQICHRLITSNALKTIAKTEYEHNFGLELATYRFLNLTLSPLSQLDSERRR